VHAAVPLPVPPAHPVTIPPAAAVPPPVAAAPAPGVPPRAAAPEPPDDGGDEAEAPPQQLARNTAPAPVAPAPPPPAEEPPGEPVAERPPPGAPAIRMSFLVFSRNADRRTVTLTIDGSGLTTLHEGEKVGGLEVVRIYSDHADLRFSGTRFSVRGRD